MSAPQETPDKQPERPPDEYGNVACADCGKMQSPSFTACIECCQHDELRLREEWHGPDDGGGWELDVECTVCGKNFGFSRDDLIENYKLLCAQRPSSHAARLI